MPEDYFLCGWRVRSVLPIPELIPWPQSDERPPDIVVEEGAVPETLNQSVTPGRYLMVDPAAGTILLRIADRVRFLVQDGCRVTVDRMNREEQDSWRLFFLGTVLGYLCHQRGVFPLHAATLRVDDRTIAIAGPPGAGKSTLAYALSQRGHRPLSDDVTVIRDGADRVEIVPAFPRLKLWRSALDAAGVGTGGLKRVRPQLEKFDLRPQGDFDLAPLSLDAVLVLGEAPDAALSRLAPTAAFPAIQAHVSRRLTAIALGHQGRLFTTTARIVSTVPIYRLLRPKRFEDLPKIVTLVEQGAAR